MNTPVNAGLSPELPKLFEPVKFGKYELTNRVKYGACCVSNFNNTDGSIAPRELARTKIIAESGYSIITNQGAYADPLGEGKAYYTQIALYDEKFLPQFETIAGYIHDNNAMAIQQILHGPGPVSPMNQIFRSRPPIGAVMANPV